MTAWFDQIIHDTPAAQAEQLHSVRTMYVYAGSEPLWPRHLGKAPALLEDSILQFRDYVRSPATGRSRFDLSRYVTAHIPFGNDSEDNCTIAAAAQLIRTWQAAGSKQCMRGEGGRLRKAAVRQEDLIRAYEELRIHEVVDLGAQLEEPFMVASAKIKSTALRRGVPALDALDYWRAQGIGEHRICGHLALVPEDRTEMELAIQSFMGVYQGLQLPATAWYQQAWHVSPTKSYEATPNSFGGHVVAVIGFDTQGLTAVSWGQIIRMTWDFWRAYGDEAYVVASSAFLDQQVGHEGNLDFERLAKDLESVGTEPAQGPRRRVV